MFFYDYEKWKYFLFNFNDFCISLFIKLVLKYSVYNILFICKIICILLFRSYFVLWLCDYELIIRIKLNDSL